MLVPRDRPIRGCRLRRTGKSGSSRAAGGDRELVARAARSPDVSRLNRSRAGPAGTRVAHVAPLVVPQGRTGELGTPDVLLTTDRAGESGTFARDFNHIPCPFDVGSASPDSGAVTTAETTLTCLSFGRPGVVKGALSSRVPGLGGRRTQPEQRWRPSLPSPSNRPLRIAPSNAPGTA